MAQGQIKFGVGFNVDKSGLNTLKASLKDIQKLTTADIKIGGNAEETLQRIQGMASKVEGALEKAFNPNLGTVNLTKFNNELKTSGLSIGQLGAEFAKAGVKGEAAFRNLSTQLLTTKVQVKQTHELLDKMANTLSNTVRWSIASGAVNALTGSIQKAYNYTVNLDTSLNDIRIVTEKSAEEMDRFAVKANNAAKALGASTKAYADASLIYFQQGLSDADVEARSQVTLKAANITGQSAQAVSEQLTAVWNGYKVSAAEAELYVDKLSAVAATTAADLEELSTGMSRVASAANIMGVDVDQLNAQLATIVSVTREAPESIGTALKTVYARMSDLEAGLDAETTLGEYTQQMAQFGIQALDATGNLRDMGDVVEEIGSRWNSLSRNQQVALAQTIAGTRQYGRMMALFDNWGMYEEALKTSANAAGTLQKQQDIYMESTEAHLQKLSTQAEELYAHLFDAESVNDVADALTKLVELVDGFVQSVGGGAGVLQMLGTIGLNVFSTQISKGLSTTIKNLTSVKDATKQLAAQEVIARELGLTDTQNEQVKTLIKYKQDQLQLSNILSDADNEWYNSTLVGLNDIWKKQDEILHQKEEYVKTTNKEINAEKAKQKAIAEQYKKEQDGTIAFNAEGITTRTNSSISKQLEQLRIRQKNQATYKTEEEHAKKLAAAAPINSKSKAYNLQELANLAPIMTENEAEIQSLISSISKSNISLDQIYEDALKLRNQFKEGSEKYNKIQSAINEMDMKIGGSWGIDEEGNAVHHFDAAKKPETRVGNIEIGLETQSIMAEVIAEANEEIKEYSRSIEVSSKAEEKMSAQTKELDKKLESLKTQASQTEEQLTTFKKSFNLEKSVKQVVSLVGNVSNLVTGFKMLNNIGDIWNNEDLDTGEKFAQILTNMTMAGGLLGTSVVPMIQKVITGYQQYKKATEAIAAAEQTLAIAKRASARINQQSITDTNILNLAKKYNVEVTEEEIRADRNAVIEKVKNAIASTQQSASETIETSIIQKNTAATLKNIAAKALQHWYILAIVAAVGLVAAAIYASVKAYNADAEAAREAAKAAEELKTAYEDVKAANEELKKSLADYSEAQKALDEMTKGTEEWEEALRNANIQVLDLIKRYPELLNYLDKTEDGRLTLTKEGQYFIKQKGNAGVLLGSSMFNFATARSNSATTTENITNAARSNMITAWYGQNEDDNSAEGSAGGTPEKLEAEEIEPILQTLLNRAGDNAISLFVDKDKNRIKELTGADDAIIDALLKNADAVIEMTNELNQTNKINSLITQQASKDYLDAYGNEDYNKSQYQDQIAAAMSKQFNNEKAYTDKKEEWSDKSDKTGHLEYLKYMQETGQWSENIVYTDDGNGIGVFTDRITGDTIELSDDTIWSALAQRDVMNEANKKTSETISAVNALVAVGTGTSDSVKSGLANLAGAEGSVADLSNLTQAEFDQFQNALNNLELTTEQINALGYSSTEEFNKTKADSINAYNTALATVGDMLTETAKNKFNNLFNTKEIAGLQDLTLKEKQNFGKLYKEIFATSGEEGLDAIEKILKDAGNKSDELIEFITTTNLNWSAEDIDQQLREKLEKLNIELDEISFNNLIQQMQAINGVIAVFDLTKVQEQISKVNSIINGLKEQGDTISVEDYKALGTAAEGYFTQMADGTYMLTTSAASFAKIMQQAQFDKDLEKFYNEVNNTITKTETANKARGELIDIQSGQYFNTAAADKAYGTSRFGDNVDGDGLTDWKKSELIWYWLNYTPEGIAARDSGSFTYEGKTVEFDLIDGSGGWYDALSDFDRGKVFEHDIAMLDYYRAGGGNKAAMDAANVDNAKKAKSNLDKLLAIGAIDYAKKDEYGSALDKIINGDFSDLSVLDTIRSLVLNNKETADIYYASITEDATNLLKRATSNEELENYKKQIWEKFGGDTMSEEVKNALNNAFNSTEVLAVVEENKTNMQLEKYESQVEYLEKINSEYEHMNSLLDQQRNLIKLTMGEDAYEEMAESYEKSVTAIDGIMSNNKASMDYWIQEMNKALAEGDTKLYEAAKAQWEEASFAYYESMSQKIELLKEQEINAINAVFKARESLGTKSLDYMTENWELSKTKSDMWLDPINAAYGIDQVRNKFNKALNNTSDINAQKQIRNLMEEQLEALEAQDKLSEYDLKRAEAKLALLEKEIALRDAQNNKTKMQLMRGADGSYSYQYIADASAVTEAEEELATAQNELYNIDLDEYKSNLDKILDAYQEFQDKYTTAAEAGNRQLMELLTTEYLGPEGILTTLMGKDENVNILTNLSESLSMFGTSLSAISVGGEDIQTWLQSFDAQGLINTLKDIPSFAEEMEISTDTLNNSLTNTLSTVEKIADTMKNATWGENATSGIFGSWDPEKIGSSIVDAMSKIKLEWKEGENGQGSWEWVAAGDTGLYTGTWGKEGKFLMAHEKELLLNKQDTENILNAVSVMRSIDASMLSTLARLNGVSAGGVPITDSGDKTIEQKVEITATFPNVNVKDEIEEAFDELINLATQHAFTNKK